MVATYTIFGQKVGSHVLSIATLTTVFGGAFLAMGGSKKAAEKGPAINASSKEEESFVKDFLSKQSTDNSGSIKQEASKSNAH